MPKISKRNSYILYALIAIALISIGIYFIISNSSLEGFTNAQPKTIEYYYMDGCGHCTQFKDVWETVKKEIVNNKLNIKPIEYNLSKEGSDRGKTFGINGTPTIIIASGDTLVAEYNNKRMAGAIIEFVKENI